MMDRHTDGWGQTNSPHWSTGLRLKLYQNGVEIKKKSVETNFEMAAH